MYRYVLHPPVLPGPVRNTYEKSLLFCVLFIKYWHESKSLFVHCVGMKQERYCSYPECDAPLPFASKLAIVTLVEAESET